MRGYLPTFAAACAALLIAAAGFTRLIDPYGYWDGPVVDGLNRYKPASGRHLAAVKLRQAARVQPATIVAGNSRVDVGFDPKSPAWLAAMRPVYNLGLPGYGTAGVADALRRAMDATHPKAVVLGVDLIDFTVSRRDWTRWRGPPPPAAPAPWRERVQMLLSLDAVTDSLAAIAGQRDTYPATITGQGFNSLAEYNGFVATEGHAALFAQRSRENIAHYRAGAKAVRWPAPGGSDAWAALDEAAALCRARGVALTVVTYPYHVSLLRAFADTGLWPAFEDWQRGLAAFGARTGVPVIDFSRVTAPSAEAVPAPGDTATRMRWYWEGGHFKAALGDRMAAEIAGRAPPDLGVRLTPANVEAELAATRRALALHR